jgi:hypothetical protein
MKQNRPLKQTAKAYFLRVGTYLTHKNEKGKPQRLTSFHKLMFVNKAIVKMF